MPSQERLPTYRLTQKGVKKNIPATDLDSLVTHHPDDNIDAVVINGVAARVENPHTRSYGVISGELQEIETRRTDGSNSPLQDHQVLLIKDFILEDSRIPPFGRGARNVDIPSPVPGYVGRVYPSQGRVDIYNHEGGEVIARVRHMDPISVRAGDTIEYGQALGKQNNIGLDYKPGVGMHVHVEVDTRYYQHFENYIADLTNGRLAVDPSRQTNGIPPLPVFDDGIFRIGETNSRILKLQEVLISRGYRDANDKPLAMDGVYRLEMQPAVLAFQQDHGLTQTGDIDRSTLHIALPLSRDQTIDRMDHVERSRAPFTPAPSSDGPVRGFQPGPDDHLRHPVHRESELHRSQPLAATSMESGRTDPRDRYHPDHAMHEGVRTKLRDLYAEQGMPIDGEKLDRLTAGVMADARGSQMTRVDLLEFSEDYDTGKVDVNGNIIAFQGDPANPASPYSATTIDQAIRTPAEDSYRQFDTATQQQTQQWDRFLAQEQELSQSRGTHHSL